LSSSSVANPDVGTRILQKQQAYVLEPIRPILSQKKMGQGAALLLRRETILRIGTQLKWCLPRLGTRASGPHRWCVPRLGTRASGPHRWCVPRLGTRSSGPHRWCTPHLESSLFRRSYWVQRDEAPIWHILSLKIEAQHRRTRLSG